MGSSLRKYIVSERFIHDGLLKEADIVIKKLYDLWKQHRRIDPSLLLWPSKYVKSEEGALVTHLVAVPLAEDHAEHAAQIKGAADHIGAYALLLVRQEGREVKAILESPHGTRSWTIPIVRSADVDILGRPKIRDDKDCLGIVWSTKQGSS